MTEANIGIQTKHLDVGMLTKDLLADENLQVSVTELKGWQFFSILVSNKESIKNNTGWLVSCQNGISRSAELFSFMKQEGFSVAKPPMGRRDGGVRISEVVQSLASGLNLHDSKIQMSGFEGGFDHLVIFANHVSSENHNWIDKIKKILQIYMKQNNLHSVFKLKIYLVDQEESETMDMVDFIRDQRSAHSTPETIVKEIGGKYNYLNGQLTFNPKLT